MSASIYASQTMLDAVFDGTTFGPLSLALSSTDPEASSLTEPTAGGYARVSVSGTDWSPATAADPSVVSNSGDLAFPQATADWGDVTHSALVDASDNVIFSAPIVRPSTGEAFTKTVTEGDTPTLTAGQAQYTMT